MNTSCFQCRQTIPGELVYCPHCGAFQRLTPAQTILRIAVRAVIGASGGVILGIVGMMLFSLLFSLGGNGFTQFRKTTFILTQMGAIWGGLVGAMCMGVYEWRRRE
jgi:hypothetical protein